MKWDMVLKKLGKINTALGLKGGAQLQDMPTSEHVATLTTD